MHLESAWLNNQNEYKHAYNRMSGSLSRHEYVVQTLWNPRVVVVHMATSTSKCVYTKKNEILIIFSQNFWTYVKNHWTNCSRLVCIDFHAEFGNENLNYPTHFFQDFQIFDCRLQSCGEVKCFTPCMATDFVFGKVEIWNYFLKIQGHISRTTEPIAVLFTHTLVHFSCWIQIQQ